MPAPTTPTRSTLAPLAAALAVALAPAAAPAADLRGGRPDWLSGDSLEWPSSLYVTGVGQADQRSTAEERARAELARVFSTKVVARTQALEEERSAKVGAASEVRHQAVRTDDVRTSTSRELVGVRIAASWEDPQTRQQYALAVLDRREAAGRVQAELDRIDAELLELRPRLAGPARLEAASAAFRCRELVRARAPLATDLALITPRSPPAPVPALEGDVRAALSRVVVAVEVLGDPDGKVSGGVAKALGALGLTPSGSPDVEADLVVGVEVGFEDLGRREGWYVVRGAANVTVRDERGGRDVAQFHETARATATAAGEVQGRAGQALAASLEKRLAAEIAAGLARL